MVSCGNAPTQPNPLVVGASVPHGAVGRPSKTSIAALPFAASLMLCLVLLAQAGCVSKPRRDDVGWRPVTAADPVQVASFRVVGRLAVSDGRDGGSASFLWTQRGDAYELELRQPVTQRTWRLHGDARGAVLDGADDGPRQAASGEQLLREVLGWEVPVAAMRDWVRGLASAGLPVQDADRDDQGRLMALHQGGWRVAYRSWLDGGDWPTRIHAQQPPYSLRLSIQDWFVRDAR